MATSVADSAGGQSTSLGLDGAIADVEEQLSMTIGRIRQVWKDAAQRIHPDLQPVGYKILSTIVRLETTSAQTLTQLLDVDKSVVSRQVRMLEEFELVMSRPDDHDGRARVLSPTPQAVASVTAARASRQARLRTLLLSRSEAELRAFTDMLRLLNEAG